MLPNLLMILEVYQSWSKSIQEIMLQCSFLVLASSRPERIFFCHHINAGDRCKFLTRKVYQSWSKSIQEIMLQCSFLVLASSRPERIFFCHHINAGDRCKFLTRKYQLCRAKRLMKSPKMLKNVFLVLLSQLSTWWNGQNWNSLWYQFYHFQYME